MYRHPVGGIIFRIEWFGTLGDEKRFLGISWDWNSKHSGGMMLSMWENLTLGVCMGVIHRNGLFNIFGYFWSGWISVGTYTVGDDIVLRWVWKMW